MNELIALTKYPVQNVLSKLLKDKTTGKNIIYATDAYSDYGCLASDEMNAEKLGSFSMISIQPRVLKDMAEQSERTRSKAEVFTPIWIVKKMNDLIFCDNWENFVKLRILEITCGEAPFLVTRYDTTTGELIPVPERVGILDRKLQAIPKENADIWLEWAYKAYQNTYGYEFQGDNLLIARSNLLITFCDYLQEYFQRSATDEELNALTNIIVRNIWQMDGLQNTVPVGAMGEDFHQFSLFDDEPVDLDADDCKIYDWRKKKPLLFRDIKEGKQTMKFDFVIGNPPYQDETDSDSTRMPPIYHYFYDSAFSIADKVELITPARFLFDAGYTPKEWNQKMLHDTHFKVLHYEPISSAIFKNTDIKGGVAITYRDATKNFGAIEIFTKHSELNDILKKVKSKTNEFIDSIIYPTLSFKLSELMLKEHPDSVGRLRTSAFTVLKEIFFETIPNDGNDYISMIGILNGKRTIRYVRRDYLIDNSGTLDKYTLLMPNASGSGEYGEKLATAEIAKPSVAFSQSFNAFGKYDDEISAVNTGKYIKTKFARSLLGVLKITQHLSAPKWKYVPLQDFTANSDIDWTQPIPDIDRQLYAKYGLTPEEIDFIETHVKEME